MKPKEKTYNFKLYQENLSDEVLIQKIRNAISTLPVCCFSFVVVELFDLDTNPGIAFFQTIHERAFKKTKLYTFEIRLNIESNGKFIWKIYRKCNQTKKQVLQAFEEICVKRISPDISDWEESDICSDDVNPKDKNLNFVKNMKSDYFAIDLPTPIDTIKYWEALRYYINNYNHYIADKWVLLADQYCNNGQYQKAKAIYELVTFAPEATFRLANMIMSGQLGKPNYKLAYEYYKHTCLIDEVNYYGAKLEIAKMHKDGKHFKPNYQIYKKMITTIKNEYFKENLIYPYDEKLYYEFALLELNNGDKAQAIHYCLEFRKWAMTFFSYGYSKVSLANAIKNFKLLYTLTEFEVASANAFDLLYLLNTPLKVTLVYANTLYEIESFYDKKYLIIKFNENYYRGAVNFFFKATLGGHRFLHEANKITIIEVLK